eukprot:tig00000492_g1496.t1
MDRKRPSQPPPSLDRDLAPATSPPPASLLGVLGAVSPLVARNMSPRSQYAISQVSRHTRQTYPEYQQPLREAWARFNDELSAWRLRRARAALDDAFGKLVVVTFDLNRRVRSAEELVLGRQDSREVQEALQSLKAARVGVNGPVFPSAGEILAFAQAIVTLYERALLLSARRDREWAYPGWVGSSTITDRFDLELSMARSVLDTLQMGEVIARLGPDVRPVRARESINLDDWEAANPRPVPPPRPLVGAPTPAALAGIAVPGVARAASPTRRIAPERGRG